MPDDRPTLGSSFSMPKSELDGLLQDLQERGYQTLGPTIQNQQLRYGPIQRLSDLPFGYSSDSSPGQFTLLKTDNQRYFEARPGGDSWKKYLFPPRSTLFSTRKRNGAFEINQPAEEPVERALVGIRPCDIAAIEVQDRVFLREDFRDPIYQQRREHLFILAVDCHNPCPTGFCHSMGTGPEVKENFDLALSEMDDVFLVRVGSEMGADLLRKRKAEPTTAYQQRAADNAIERAIQRMPRQLEIEGLADSLINSLSHPHWEQVAARCLNCTNCTLVCPTCFCWDVQDQVDLSGQRSKRVRSWDSCFNPDHSYHAGGGFTHPTVKSRYRQWLTHKLGTWVEQFGVSGCIGCGRCITWCPAGIDITEEVAAIRQEKSV